MGRVKQMMIDQELDEREVIDREMMRREMMFDARREEIAFRNVHVRDDRLESHDETRRFPRKPNDSEG